MLRFLCILLIILLCGCTTDLQNKTFKEKYNVYAEPIIDEGAAELPFPDSVPSDASSLMQSAIPIKQIENFADAIIRRMDARDLEEYHKIQNEIDTRYAHILLRPAIPRDPDNIPSHWETFIEYSKDNILFGFYTIRDEAGIKRMVATIQHAKYLIAKQRE